MNKNSLIFDKSDNPLQLLEEWFNEAIDKKVQRHPNAMSLSTVGNDNTASARMVLVKDLSSKLDYITFYTNYLSRKSQQLNINNSVAGIFHWDMLGRQIRMEGKAIRSPDIESNNYFSQRSWLSQLNAWSSMQSQPLKKQDDLKKEVIKKAEAFGISSDQLLSKKLGNKIDIPRPSYWGGFRFWMNMIEFWHEGKDRYHERLCFRRKIEAKNNTFVCSKWKSEYLQP